MSLNIKIPEAHELAKELAELTGESMAKATTEALRERRDRIRSERSEGADRLLALAREIGTRMPPGFAEGDPTEDLYDEQGLPVGD